MIGYPLFKALLWRICPRYALAFQQEKTVLPVDPYRD